MTNIAALPTIFDLLLPMTLSNVARRQADPIARSRLNGNYARDTLGHGA